MLKYFDSKMALRSRIEFYTFVGLAINWSIVSVIIAVGNPKSGRIGIGNAVVVFSWVNIIAHILSSIIAFTEQKLEGS